jgi:ribosome maturation factor RimP
MSQEKIWTFLEEPLGQLGYDIWYVRIKKSKGEIPEEDIQVILENKQTKTLLLDECIQLSKTVEDLLRNNGFWSDQTALEVSSPGVERPLIIPAHYERFLGVLVTATLTQAVDGRRKVQGVLKDVSDQGVILEGEEELLTWAKIKTCHVCYVPAPSPGRDPRSDTKKEE